MMDEQIIKALTCCTIGEMNCKDCPNNAKGVGCINETMKFALDLINRQKSEIEQLRSRDEEFLIKNYSFDKYYDEHITRAKSEAIKEFAERLKRNKQWGIGKNGYVHVSDIDYLVEEMMEDKK